MPRLSYWCSLILVAAITISGSRVARAACKVQVGTPTVMNIDLRAEPVASVTILDDGAAPYCFTVGEHITVTYNFLFGRSPVMLMPPDINITDPGPGNPLNVFPPQSNYLLNGHWMTALSLLIRSQGNPGSSIQIATLANATTLDTGEFALRYSGQAATVTVSIPSPTPTTSTYTVGTAYAARPLQTFPYSIDFGSAEIGSGSPSRTITVSNGPFNASIDNVFIAGSASDFTLSHNCPAVLAGFASCAVVVAFRPVVAGTRRGELVIWDNTPNEPHTVDLTGTGLGRGPITLTPSYVEFASQFLGSKSAVQQITVQNQGQLAVSIGAIVATGDFSQANNCGAQLDAGASCQVNVSFTPRAAGTRSGSLRFTDNAPASPQTASLFGRGTTVPASAPAITAIAPEQVRAGGSAFTLTVSGGNFQPAAVVLWNNAPRPTSFVSDTQLLAAIAASDISAPGMAQIGVLNPAEGGAAVNRVALLINRDDTVPAPGPPLRFVPVTPCRVVDTRMQASSLGGPALSAQVARTFSISSGSCGVPYNAAAYSLNAAVVPLGSLGYLTLWGAGQTQPLVSALNSLDGRVKSNAIIVSAGSGGAIQAFASDSTHLILDVNGYFVPATDPGGLAFYNVQPCRLSDTRLATGPLGGPSLAAGERRTIPVPASSCGVPATAQAYSLNLTVVPHGSLGFLVAWPTGQPQPFVATLNATTGTVTANAALVLAGANGAVDVFATNDSDLIVDLNGYFAPPGEGGLSFYALPPCRALDTRMPASAVPFHGVLDINLAAASCGIPAAAQAMVLSSTVVPRESLGYMSLWPRATVQPFVATLNATDSAVTSNLAIVPSSQGSISVFTTGTTDLVLDVLGYLAP